MLAAGTLTGGAAAYFGAPALLVGAASGVGSQLGGDAMDGQLSDFRQYVISAGTGALLVRGGQALGGADEMAALNLRDPQPSLRQLTNRANELLDKGARYKSTAVGRYEDGSLGIASSDELVPRVQRVWAEKNGIRVVNGEGHADVTLVNGATNETGALRAAEVSSPHGKSVKNPNGAICQDCQKVYEANGVKTTTPFSGKPSRKRHP